MKHLMEFREEKKMSRLELAFHAKVSLASITHWENGTRSPKTNHLIQLCNALGVTPNDLLGFAE